MRARLTAPMWTATSPMRSPTGWSVTMRDHEHVRCFGLHPAQLGLAPRLARRWSLPHCEECGARLCSVTGCQREPRPEWALCDACAADLVNRSLTGWSAWTER